MENFKKPLLAAVLLLALSSVYADKPCWQGNLKENRSAVCVCTAEYCDDVTRDVPTTNKFVTYSSSEGGQRFEKKVEDLENFSYNNSEQTCLAKGGCLPAFYLDSKILYQKIEGFGGAVTDAASINWNSLKSKELKQHLINSYFGKNGLEYNMMRVPIGGSDFSTRPYAYNEYPAHDFRLSNYRLTTEDYKHKIPMIKASFKEATSKVQIVASVWSPPPWMKSNNKISGLSRLLYEHYQTYADYHLKFLQLYEMEGVPVWALTTTNEPSNGVMNIDVPFNTLGWLPLEQGKWIAENLGPTIRNSTFKDVKILAVDDQRNLLATYFNYMTYSVPKALPYIDGVAVHFYLDKQVPPEQLTYTMKNHPDKFIISTEACTGAMLGEKNHVDLGSWERAQQYMTDILENLNFNATGWIDWNLCLDEQGGPNWAKNFVDSPIIVSNDKLRFYKQPMFYAMGHVSKFVPRGSRRIKVDLLCQKTVEHVAFLTPNSTVVTVLHNIGEETVVHLVTCNKLAKVPMQKNSIVTVEFLQENCP